MLGDPEPTLYSSIADRLIIFFVCTNENIAHRTDFGIFKCWMIYGNIA